MVSKIVATAAFLSLIGLGWVVLLTAHVSWLMLAVAFWWALIGGMAAAGEKADEPGYLVDFSGGDGRQ